MQCGAARWRWLIRCIGTTATHFLALRQKWGDARWQAWCRALVANKPFVVDGNSIVARKGRRRRGVVRVHGFGRHCAEQPDGKPVVALPLSEESLIVHNSAGVVRGAPHPAEAQKLFEYLQSTAVQERLVQAKALESAVPGDPNTLPGLKVDWDAMLRDLDAAHEGIGSNFSAMKRGVNSAVD